MAPRYQDNLPLVVSAASVTTALLTYFVTKKVVTSKLQQQVRDFEESKKRTSIVSADFGKLAAEVEKEDDSDDVPSMGIKIPDAKIDEIYLWEIEHLGNKFETAAKGVKNVMGNMSFRKTLKHGDSVSTKLTEYNTLIESHECVLGDLVRKPGQKPYSKAYIRAGPRDELHFHPDKVNAAIVTCGGLCPGLNNVVREITMSLHNLYNIKGKVWGIRGGYAGFYKEDLPPFELTPKFVENIHHSGGTVLASSRGGFELDKIIEFLKKYDISQLFVIGGDGTHRGAFRIHEECVSLGMNVAVAGIPKTIDNDVDYIDRSFGFISAVEAAQEAIRIAKTEAACNLPNGIGIVKLMGRSAGYIAAHSTLGSSDVDLCLVPEVPIVLEGPNGCLPHLERVVKEKGYAVVVVAEGAGEELLGTSAEVDASGNKKLPKIGEFMKSATEEYFKKNGKVATVKYIDPSYMVRSVPANSNDALYCSQLAQNAVHGAMAGFTGFSVGLCNNKMVLLPIPELVSTSPRKMNSHGRTWERILASTRQPNTVPPKN